MKNIKRGITIALIAAMVLALAAGLGGCGKQSGQASASAAPTGDVYVPEYITVKNTFTNGINNVCYAGDKFYVSTSEVVGDSTPAGVTPDYEGQYSVYGMAVYKVGMDGSCEKFNYTPSAVPEGQQGNVNMQNMTASADGTLYMLEDVYTYTNNAPDGMTQDDPNYWNYYQSSDVYRLRAINPDGSDLATIDLSSLNTSSGAADNGNGNNAYPNGFTVDKDGNIYLLTNGNTNTLYVFDKTGKQLYTIDCGQNPPQSITTLKDGRIACLAYVTSDDKTSGAYQLQVVDTAAKAFGGDSIKLPPSVYSIIPGGGDYDFYYNNGSNFFGYKIDGEKNDKLFNWINCDVDSDSMSGVVVMDDGRVAGFSSSYGGAVYDGMAAATTAASAATGSDVTQQYTCELVILTKKPASSVPQKTHITLATQSLDYSVRGSIISFNKSSDKYHIDVEDYSEYNTDTDSTAGMKKLTTEILAGNMPDILDLNGMPEEQLAEKKLLEDLYPYIDSDADMKREDFFPNLIKALEVDGKLYTTCNGFSIFTAIGAKSVVGDTPGWTVDEFNAALAKMPEGCTAFDQYVTRDDILTYSLGLDMDSFVNWSTGECTFDSDAFVKLLEFAKSFPSTFDWEHYQWTDADNPQTRIANGQQMLYMTSLSDFQSFQMYKALFGGDITCIGFPTAYGNGNMFTVSGGYAISASSQNKDAAWSFIRQFMLPAFQTGNYAYQFPSNMNAFNQKLKTAMTPEYQKDENGNYVLDANGNKIEVSQGGWSWGNSDTIEIHALTQDEADQITALINSTTKIMNTDQSINSIVKEEAAPYFADQKSAEEIAKLVQSKVSIYVNEQR